MTDCFTNVQKISGQLVVDPATLTVWTGSAEKIYDGKELVNSDAKITSARGYDASQSRWRNLSYVLSDTGETGDECQTLYGLCGVVWVHGTNPITGETREIKLEAGQKLTVFLHDDRNVQTIEFKKEDIDPEDLPEKILRLFQHNPALLTRACSDCSWKPERLKEIINSLPKETEDAQLVQKHGILVEESEAGQLMTDFTNVRITIDTDITDYTDRALSQDEAKYTPIIIDERIRIKATGSQTDVGESKNTYQITWGGARKGNYVLNEELGIFGARIRSSRVLL